MISPIILHIDFDSFFASVEQQNNPSLRSKPIGVTAATSRTAVIAASREAKKYGVVGGSSAKDALKVCPHLQLVPAHFVEYFEISKKFLTICKKYSPDIEVFSIDELFMDVTHTSHFFKDVFGLITQLKKDIAKKIGPYITVSVGVSYNKMLAKMASGLNKPDGITIINPEDVEKIYAKATLTDICGIGSRISQRLVQMGITNLLQLRHIPFESLKAEFGPHEAQFLVNVAWARDETEVVHFGNAPEVKSVGRNYCLARNEYDKRRILQHIFELYEEIAIKLRRLQKKARCVGYYLGGNVNLQGRQTVGQQMDTGKDMFSIFFNKKNTKALLQEVRYIRRISVWASSLEDSVFVQPSLFERKQQGNVVRVVDELNEKFGDHTIRNGFLLKAPKLTTVPNGFLADKWERMQLTKLY